MCSAIDSYRTQVGDHLDIYSLKIKIPEALFYLQAEAELSKILSR